MGKDEGFFSNLVGEKGSRIQGFKRFSTDFINPLSILSTSNILSTGSTNLPHSLSPLKAKFVSLTHNWTHWQYIANGYILQLFFFHILQQYMKVRTKQILLGGGFHQPPNLSVFSVSIFNQPPVDFKHFNKLLQRFIILFSCFVSDTQI